MGTESTQQQGTTQVCTVFAHALSPAAGHGKSHVHCFWSATLRC
jgi:hypothetical protein